MVTGVQTCALPIYRIQETAQGRVTPENFTHGSAEQRMEWFATGYDEATPAACDTFRY